MLKYVKNVQSDIFDLRVTSMLKDISYLNFVNIPCMFCVQNQNNKCCINLKYRVKNMRVDTMLN